MMEIQPLNDRYAIKNQLEVFAGKGGFPLIKINNQHAKALISLYGGQVLSFQPHHQAEDLLFLSEKSLYQPGKAIRGGIPVCWPWFGPDPKGLQRPNHGFVRNHFWQISKTAAINEGTTQVSLAFNESLKQENTWRQPFTVLLEITVGSELRLAMTTRNTGDKSFSITQAFHSYFRVGDIEQIKVEGLQGCDYFDKLDQGTQKRQDDELRIGSEIDRVYVEARRDLSVIDPVLQRRIRIQAPNTSTAVVWNPWQQTCQKMADLTDFDYQRFICVEAGNIAFDLIQIAPGNDYRLSVDFALSAL